MATDLLTQAITLVLHHPEAAAAVPGPEALGRLDKPGISVLQELLVRKYDVIQQIKALI